jgi:hypothetical protein
VGGGGDGGGGAVPVSGPPPLSVTPAVSDNDKVSAFQARGAEKASVSAIHESSRTPGSRFTTVRWGGDVEGFGVIYNCNHP